MSALNASAGRYSANCVRVSSLFESSSSHGDAAAGDAAAGDAAAGDAAAGDAAAGASAAGDARGGDARGDGLRSGTGDESAATASHRISSSVRGGDPAGGEGGWGGRSEESARSATSEIVSPSGPSSAKSSSGVRSWRATGEVRGGDDGLCSRSCGGGEARSSYDGLGARLLHEPTGDRAERWTERVAAGNPASKNAERGGDKALALAFDASARAKLSRITSETASSRSASRA